MDIKEKIQLGEFQNVDSLNEDNTMKLDLTSSQNVMLEYDIDTVIDVTEIFENERQNINTYRIYGEIEYLAILNNLIKNYSIVNDFFTQQPLSADTKNILTDFKFYLVKPTTAFTELITDERYLKNYEIIAVIDNFDIFTAGYSLNIFGEQQYAFDFNIDFDISNLVDGLGFPITTLSLYAVYQPQANGDGDFETMESKTYNSTGGTVIIPFTPINLEIGDIIEGDVINYDKDRFLQSDFNTQEYFIFTPYDSDSLSLKWKYDPLIPITLLIFSDDLQMGNTGSTSVENVNQIPSYATEIDNQGNFVWRNIEEKGFIDPLTGVGVNFPFVNGKNYVFNNIILSISPDLSDSNTASVFSEISFAGNTFISAEPSSPLTNINQLCD